MNKKLRVIVVVVIIGTLAAAALGAWWHTTSKTSGLGYALVNIWANWRAGDPLWEYPPPIPSVAERLTDRYFIEEPRGGDYVLFPVEVKGYTHLPGADCSRDVALPPLTVRNESGAIIYSQSVQGTCEHDNFVSYDVHLDPGSTSLPDSGSIAIASTSIQVYFKPGSGMEAFTLCGTPLVVKRIVVNGIDAFNAIMQIKNTSASETVADKRRFCQSLVYDAKENHRVVLTDVTRSGQWMYVDITGDNRYAINLNTNAIYPISGFDGSRSKIPSGYLK